MSTSSSIPTLYAKSLYPSLICLNVTRLSAVEKGYDATVDVFLIQLKSDKGDTENYLYSMGTNSNASFSDFNSVSQAISSKINNFANIRTINGGESYFAVNTTSNQSILGTSVGSIGSYTNKPSGLGLWELSQPNTVTVTIRRLGSISLKGTTVLTTFANPHDFSMIQLEHFGNGFLANKIVPKEKLSQTNPFAFTSY